MSFSAQVFRVLIASPSDVAAEREIAVRVIQAWNDLNSHDRQVVLLPLRWETHTAPEYGKRPQAVINSQIVDHCDLLVGIFWTRIGSPTGVADSGSLEEIERVAAEGKPVMLYFSQVKQDPDEIDVEQLTSLRDFKKKTFPKALVESYSNQDEFRDKLGRQIEIQLRTLLAMRSGEDPGAASSPVTDVRFHFADPENREDLGTEHTLSTKLIRVDNFESIPDFNPPDKTKPRADQTEGKLWQMRILSDLPNKDFYRETISLLFIQNLLRPVRFWAKNFGAIGARDVYIDVSITSNAKNLIVIARSSFPTRQPSPTRGGFTIQSFEPAEFKSPSELIAGVTNRFRTQLELRALQPQREVTPPVELYLGATEDTTVTIDAIVYADTLAKPDRQQLTLNIKVSEEVMSADDLLTFTDKNRIDAD